MNKSQIYYSILQSYFGTVQYWDSMMQDEWGTKVGKCIGLDIGELKNSRICIGRSNIHFPQMIDGGTKSKTWQVAKYGIFEYELKIIQEKEFGDYFLIVSDIINWTKEKFGKYSAGAGRGSGSGSIVNYLLNITDINPITYNLLFERFLDPSREDVPDIDSDSEGLIRKLCCDAKQRQEVSTREREVTEVEQYTLI